MQFGLFADFGIGRETTLLVWGAGSDLQPLIDALDELAQGRRNAATLDGPLGAKSVGGAKVCIEVASQDAVIKREDSDGSAIQLRCRRDRCGELADQLRTLVAPAGKAGHHYLDLALDQPIEIVVSAGEYPADFKPS